MPSRSSAWSSAMTTRTAAPPCIGRPLARLADDPSMPSSASTRCLQARRPRPRGPRRPGRRRRPRRPGGRVSSNEPTRAARAGARAWRRSSATRRRRSTRRTPRPAAGGASSVHVDRDRQRERSPSASTRRRQAAVGQHRRGDAPGEVAQLADRVARLDAGAAHELGGLGMVVQALLGAAELHAQRDEPRLGAVVQVALDPPQLRGLDVQGAAAGAGRARRRARRARARAPGAAARGARRSRAPRAPARGRTSPMPARTSRSPRVPTPR